MDSPMSSPMVSPLASDQSGPRLRPSASSSSISVRRASPSPSPSPAPAASESRSAPVAASARSRQTLMLGLLFVAALAGLWLFVQSLPQIDEADRPYLKFPRSLSDVRSLSVVVRKYRDHNEVAVLGAFSALYIFLQAFAIPGAVFLSILAGPLFGVWRGLAIVSAVATCGSSVCFGLSRALGRGLVERAFPALLAKFRARLQSHRHNLFFYLLFLRISPLLPNWFISISSPLLGVPYPTFALATLVGLLPANYLHVSTGTKLGELGEGGEGSPVNLRAMAFLLGIAFLALLPTLFRSKFEAMDSSASPQPSASPSPATSASADPFSSPPVQKMEEGAQEGAVASRTRSAKKKTG